MTQQSTKTQSRDARSAAFEPGEARRPALLLAVAAGLCWACAFALLISGNLDKHPALLAPLRLIFYALIIGAGLLTFVPFQRRLGLSGLVFEGVVGTVLLFYVLAFVPPPTAWLLSLPDALVYLLLALGLFWTLSAVSLPIMQAYGRRIFRQRAQQYDIRRARRQSHEIGLLAALCVGLSGLRALTIISVVLLALILVAAELLFLAFVEPTNATS